MDQRTRRELKAAIDARAREPGKPADAYAMKRELEAAEEGQDLSAETAQNLQNRMGNQAINSMINKNSNNAQEGAGLEVEVEEEQEVEVEEDAPDKDEDASEHEDARSQYGGSAGGGAGGGGGGANPWDMQNLFGGDDDDDGGTGRPRRRRMRSGATRNFPGMGAQDLLPEKVPGALEAEDLSAIDGLLGALGAVPAAARWGDAIYEAPELALADPRRIGRRVNIEPEDLVDQTGLLDPLGRPAEIGRFLAEAGDGMIARSVARVLAGPSSVLFPAATGHAGAAGRLSALAVCAEALEGGGVDTDRAVSLALRRDAWPDALDIAQEIGATGALFAPQIAQAALGPNLRAGEDGDLEEPSHLGGRALERVVPEGPEIWVPGINAGGDGEPKETDAAAASIDALLDQLLGGVDPDAPPPDPVLTQEAIAPVLASATALVGAFGRAQVELAAAAMAVRRVTPNAPVAEVLERSDQALRQLARGVMRDGRKLEKLVGSPINAAATSAAPALAGLREAANNVRDLRVWAFSNLAGAVNAEGLVL